MNCVRCQHENAPTMKFCGECGTPLTVANPSSPPAPSYAEITRALSDALEQQTATSEVLRVISRSTFDLQPVLDTLIENATRLCDAAQGLIYRFDGAVFGVGAFYGASPELREFWQRGEFRPGRESCVGRVGLEHRTVQIADVLADPDYHESAQRNLAGVRTVLGVPMLREGVLIGALIMWRTEVRPFTDKQVELVTSFADQAVIAIENVRLLTELQARTSELTRSVDELKALGEVSRAVSSTLDVETVLNTVVGRANQLAGADACTSCASCCRCSRRCRRARRRCARRSMPRSSI